VVVAFPVAVHLCPEIQVLSDHIFHPQVVAAVAVGSMAALALALINRSEVWVHQLLVMMGVSGRMSLVAVAAVALVLPEQT
jgi:energy-converting hydrogenase Eha subunit G